MDDILPGVWHGFIAQMCNVALSYMYTRAQLGHLCWQERKRQGHKRQIFFPDVLSLSPTASNPVSVNWDKTVVNDIFAQM